MNFDKIIDRTNTYCTQWDFVEDRFGKKDLLPFTISDMDFQSPPEIIDILIKRVNHGIFGYSRWNHNDYKNSIKNWYQKRFDFIIDENWISYSPNVIYSVAKFIEFYSKENDNILITTPAYDGFFKVIKNNNRNIITTSLFLEDDNYYLNFEDFEEKCKISKIFLFCNPHNPTGKVWSYEEIKKIIAICKKYNVFIISDEIHMDIVYNGKHIPILKVDNSYLNNMIICTSASKTFNLPALGGSYLLVPNLSDWNKFNHILKNVDSLSSASILAVISTITAYNKCEYWVEELLQYTKNNIIFIKEYLTKNIPELTCEMPQGCYFTWISFKNLNISSEEFQNILINIGNLAIMPGVTYGEDGKYFLRLNIACPRTKIQKCLINLKKCVDFIRKKNIQQDAITF